MTWEYRTISLAAEGWLVQRDFDLTKLDQMMNVMGRAGWELVSAFDTNFNNGGTNEAILIFKRPCRPEDPNTAAGR